jgi:hypothetical protein
MATCSEKPTKNTLSLNPSKKDQKLALEEICMPFLHLILMSMEVVETFLLETKESSLKKTKLAKLIDLKVTVTSSQQSTKGP